MVARVNGGARHGRQMLISLGSRLQRRASCRSEASCYIELSDLRQRMHARAVRPIRTVEIFWGGRSGAVGRRDRFLTESSRVFLNLQPLTRAGYSTVFEPRHGLYTGERRRAPPFPSASRNSRRSISATRSRCRIQHQRSASVKGRHRAPSSNRLSCRSRCRETSSRTRAAKNTALTRSRTTPDARRAL